LYNETVQTSSILYSTKCKPQVNTNTVFIYWLVVEVNKFEHGGGSFKNTNFDEICIEYVL